MKKLMNKYIIIKLKKNDNTKFVWNMISYQVLLIILL